MSFVLSPQAVLFDLQQQLNEQQAIFNSNLQKLQNFVIPEPQFAIETFSEVKAIRPGISEPVVTTREVFINQNEIRLAQGTQNTFRNTVEIARSKITELINQISIVEVDLEAKTGTIDLQTTPLIETDFANTLLPPGESQQTIDIDVVVQPKQDNTVRNLLIALVVGGLFL